MHIIESIYKKAGDEMELQQRDDVHPHIYAGVGFIRTRKPECRIMDFTEGMTAYAERRYTTLLEIIVDRGDEIPDDGDVDIDRFVMNKLYSWMKKDFVKVVFIRNLNEISSNKEEQRGFLVQAEKYGVSVHCMEAGINLEVSEGVDISDVARIWDGGIGC